MADEFTLEWALDDAKRRIVEAMCVTWRHDFGLDKRAAYPLSSGMAPGEREVLLQSMGQLYEHHVASLVRAAEEQKRSLVTLDSAALRLQDEEIDRLRADLQTADTACFLSIVENKKLKAELEGLRKDAERYRWLRAQEPAAIAIGLCFKSPEKLDSAIDAAMAAKGASRG